MSARILVVDDEVEFTRMLKLFLEAEDYTVTCAGCAREGIVAIKSDTFDIVFTDIKMETDGAGYDVIRAARALPHPPALIVLTAFPLPAGLDVEASISKPSRLAEVLQLVRDLMEKRAPRSTSC